VVDPVMAIDTAGGRITCESADAIIAHMRSTRPATERLSDFGARASERFSEAPMVKAYMSLIDAA
jgi:hypothetical protein